MRTVISRTAVRSCLAGVLLVGGPFGCGGASSKASSGGTDGGTVPTFRDGGVPTEPTVRCGDAACPAPSADGPLAERSCCVGPSACGLVAPELGSSCLPRNGAGSVDLSCPARTLHDGTELSGCCTDRGACGVFDRFGDLGCVPPEIVGDGGALDAATSVACRYVPGPTCRSLVELPCDGPEDCGASASCCGRLSHGSFDRFACFPSCSEHGNGTAEVWIEICHPGEPCADPTLTCSGSSALPPFLARCHDVRPPLPPDARDGSSSDGSADATAVDTELGDARVPSRRGVTCGASVCGDGLDGSTDTPTKCCLRDTGGEASGLAPYCAPASARCECAP